VGGAESRHEAIRKSFRQNKEASFSLEFRSASRVTGVTSASAEFDVAVVDFEKDPKAAASAAFQLRSARGDLGVAVMVPSADFCVPVETIELGLGPVVVSDEEGIASLPTIAAAMSEGDEASGAEMAASSILKLRNMELRDITDSLARQSVHLIHLRNELAAEKNKLETVINGVTDGMIFFDMSGRVEMTNPVADELFPSLQTGGGAILEKFLEDLPHEGGRKALAPGGWLFETPVGGRTYRVRLVEVKDHGGAAAGSLLLFTDVTADKEYEKLKNDFTSMISHELRTPLTSIMAAVDNFISGALGEVTDRQLTFLEMIKRNVDRQQALIDDLLDLAKFEAGQMELMTERASLVGVASSCVEQFSLAFKDKNISLKLIPAGPAPLMVFDQRLLAQAVNNLLSNALKFTAEGGDVRVSVFMEKCDEIEYGCISVSDTGIGVPEEKIDKIFDKYTQIDSSTKRRYTGTGLGLAIVREIMKAHGGKVTAKSSIGEGSVFTLMLPITSEAR